MSWICAKCETSNLDKHEKCEVCGDERYATVTYPVEGGSIHEDSGTHEDRITDNSRSSISRMLALVLIVVICGCIGTYILNSILSKREPTIIVDTNELMQTAEAETATAEVRATFTAQRKVRLTAQALAGASTSQKQTTTAGAIKTATAEAQAAATDGAKTATAEARQGIKDPPSTPNTGNGVTTVARTATAKAKATATAKARMTSTVKERSADQAAIESVVRRYSDEIKIENTTDLNSSNLSQVLVDPALERQKRSTCWLENEGKYYTYSNRSLAIESVTFENDREATVLVQIGENRILRNQNGSISKDYGYDDYRAIYQLEKMSNDRWYIYCFQALEDNAPALCKVTLEGDDPCR